MTGTDRSDSKTEKDLTETTIVLEEFVPAVVEGRRKASRAEIDRAQPELDELPPDAEA